MINTTTQKRKKTFPHWKIGIKKKIPLVSEIRMFIFVISGRKQRISFCFANSITKKMSISEGVQFSNSLLSSMKI